MLWSDPSTADYIPDDLQAQNARFPFGKKQFEAFMARLGCSMMVRGHEKVDAGFKHDVRRGRVAALAVLRRRRREPRPAGRLELPHA